MRLFVAVRPSDPAIDHLAAALARTGPGTPVAAGTPGTPRWQAPDRWHLTLAFLGEVDPARVPRVVDRLARSARRHPPIGPLRLAGAGCFGRRVLWVGVAGAEQPETGDGPVLRLRRLAESVQAGLRREGLAIERRPWRAHLTLARLRAGDPAAASWAEALAGYAGPSWWAREVLLVESVLGPGAAYHDLARIALGPVGEPGDVPPP